MVWEENEITHLRITIDSDSHVLNTCFEANKKLSVLRRFKNILTSQQQRILFNSSFEKNMV